MSISETQMDRSALLARWIRGELSYARHQRIYMRRWLEHLGGLRQTSMNVDYTLSYDEPWQQRLVIDVALRTWALVKQDKSAPFSSILDPSCVWQTLAGSRVDFDLTNVNALSAGELTRAARDASAAQRRALCEQFVLRYRLSDLSESHVRTATRHVAVGNFDSLRRLLRAYEPLRPRADEPRDLMFYA